MAQLVCPECGGDRLYEEQSVIVRQNVSDVRVTETDSRGEAIAFRGEYGSSEIIWDQAECVGAGCWECGWEYCYEGWEHQMTPRAKGIAS